MPRPRLCGVGIVWSASMTFVADMDVVIKLWVCVSDLNIVFHRWRTRYYPPLPYPPHLVHRLSSFLLPPGVSSDNPSSLHKPHTSAYGPSRAGKEDHIPVHELPHGLRSAAGCLLELRPKNLSVNLLKSDHASVHGTARAQSTPKPGLRWNSHEEDFHCHREMHRGARI